MQREDVLANLGYFTEWGGRPWERLCRYAIQTMGDLQGQTVLEIGAKFGKMSACFALLGARVIGIDTNGAALKRAEEEAKHWGVHSHVSFFCYDGKLENCSPIKDLQVDLIFTKSVLVLLGSALPEYLEKMDNVLKTDGRCFFLENSYGGFAFSLVRILKKQIRKPLRKPKRRATYFSSSHLKTIDQVFPITEVRRSLIPPIHLIMSKKKAQFNEKFLERVNDQVLP